LHRFKDIAVFVDRSLLLPHTMYPILARMQTFLKHRPTAFSSLLSIYK